MEVEIQNQASQQLNVKVAVRVRPLNQREIRENKCLETNQNQIHLLQSQRLFQFDYVYDSDNTQDQIFNQCVQGLVMRCFEGYNSTLLAYGQTGSGKTYTMGTSGEEQQDVGMIPRVVQLIFQETEKRKQELDITISCSYLELYNEQIIDLLVQNSDKCQPIIREEKNHTISILNLSSVVCTNPYDMLQILSKGGYHRQTAATLMNQTSSRSHALFTIYFQINQKDDENEMGPLNAKFHFVDLAGSERLKKTLAVGKQMEEGIMINQSLLVLGNVINVLSEKKKQNQHIPYRESKLTRILQDSLGGNANTCMIACVSPSESNYEETLNTLKYASRAREIQNKPTQNRDPQVAQIMELKQQIIVLQSQLQSYAQILKENNLEVKEIQQPDTKYIGNCEDHQELISKLKSDLYQLQKQYTQQKQEFGLLSKALNESEIQLFIIKKQRDQISKQVTDLKKLLQKNNIPIGQNQIDDTVIFDQYQTEILSLKTILKQEQMQKDGMRETIEKLLMAQKRDQTILFSKQNAILRLERRIKIYSDLLPDVEFSEQSLVEEDYQVEMNESLQKQEQEIENYESQLNYMTQDTDELRQKIAKDLKEEYHLKINELEQQKAALLKMTNQKDTGQINNLKYRVAELESRIQDFKVKDNLSKQQLKKLEDQETQVRDLRLLIEKMKKQKVEMIKKLKEENVNFHKFKEERNKELFRIKKSKIQQDAKLKRLQHDIVKKDLLIKRKEDEIFKHKQEKNLKSQSSKNNQQSKNKEVEFFQKQIDSVFEELLKGEQASKDQEEDSKNVEIKQQEIKNIEERICQIMIQQEQIKLDRKFIDEEKLRILDLEYSNLVVNRESSYESLNYLLHKLNQHSESIKSSNEYYQVFLNNQFFKDIPEWMIKTLRYALESWVQTHLECLEKQQIIDEQSQNQLQQSVRQQEQSQSPNKRKYPKQSIEVQELKKQIQDLKKRYQTLMAENKNVHQELDYYKKFYLEQTYKSRSSLQARTESNQELPPSQNIQLQRDIFKLNKNQPSQSQKQLGFAMPQTSAKKKFFDKEVPLIADQLALSQELDFESPIPDRNLNQRLSTQRMPNQFQYNFEPPLEFQLIKSFVAHEAAILNIFTWENLLFTTSIKSVKIWDLEALTHISTLDVAGYARSVQYWPERNSFAISHGNNISFYDTQLSSLGTIKTSVDEIKVLCRHGSQLISGGKASINSGALQVWDYRQNNFVSEYEKGMEILTMASQDNDLYWGTFNHQVKMMHISQNRFGNIQILNPPHYDKVTGVGVLDDNILSWYFISKIFIKQSSFGKQLRLWNRNNYQITKDSSEIQKDSVNGMSVDSYNKIFYTAQKDGIVKAIKIVDGKFQHQADLIASNSSINTVSIIQQGLVATGGAEKVVKLWRPNFAQKYQLDDQLIF